MACHVVGLAGRSAAATAVVLARHRFVSAYQPVVKYSDSVHRRCAIALRFPGKMEKYHHHLVLTGDFRTRAFCVATSNQSRNNQGE